MGSLAAVVVARSAYRRHGQSSASGPIIIGILSWFILISSVWQILDYLFFTDVIVVAGSPPPFPLDIQFLEVVGLGSLQVFLALHLLRRRAWARTVYVGFAAAMVAVRVVQMFPLGGASFYNVVTALVVNVGIVYLLSRRDVRTCFSSETPAARRDASDEGFTGGGAAAASSEFDDGAGGRDLEGVRGWLKVFVIMWLYVGPVGFALSTVAAWVLTFRAMDVHPGMIVSLAVINLVSGYIVLWGMRVAKGLRDIHPRAVQNTKRLLWWVLIWSCVSISIQLVSGLIPERDQFFALREVFLAAIVWIVAYRYLVVSDRVSATYPDWNDG